MRLSARQQWAWAGAWLVIASVGFLLAAAEVQRYPLSGWVLLGGVLVPAAAIGFVLDCYRWCLLGLVYFPLVIAAAAITEEPSVVVAAPFVPVAAALAICVGVLARPRLRIPVTSGTGRSCLRAETSHRARRSFPSDGGRRAPRIGGRTERRRSSRAGDLRARAYPGLACGEGDAGEDESIPYPYRSGRTGPGAYMYVSGYYARPGTPVVQIWLGDRPFDSGVRRG